MDSTLAPTCGSVSEGILDALPVLVLVVDDDVKVEYANAAAREALGEEASRALHRRGGEVLHCVHSYNDAGGCGRGGACPDCVVRNSVRDAFRGLRTVRSSSRMTFVGPGEQRQDVTMLVTTAPFAGSPEDSVMLTLEDVTEVVSLRGIVPICSYCKKVRTEQRYWESVEKYVESHSDAQFSHSICEACLQVHFPRVVAEMEARLDQAESEG